MDKVEEEKSRIDFGVDLGEAPRAEDWGSWEQSRTRSFAIAGPFTIGDGKLGSVANLVMELKCSRTATGCEGSWAFSMEERIGPWRIERGQGTGYLTGTGGDVLSFPMPQFGHACGTRRHQWSGSLTKDQFEAIKGFRAGSNDLPVRRC